MKKKAPVKNKMFASQKKAPDFKILLLYIAIVCSFSCSDPAKIALETTDVQSGKKAVEKISDQELLGKIGIEGKLEEVRHDAIEKLTSQAVLSKVVMGSNDGHDRLSALNKMTDQELLAEIAWKSKDTDIISSALLKVKDLSQLAHIFFKANEESHLFRYMVDELLDQEMTARINAETNDDRIIFLSHVIRGFEPVPPERKANLICRMAPALKMLYSMDVEKVLGKIISISTSWTAISESYVGQLSGSKKGEKFSCTIRLSKFNKPLTNYWVTDFPYRTGSLGFLEAIVNSYDLFGSAIEILPPYCIQIIADNANDPDVVRAAQARLTALKNKRK